MLLNKRVNRKLAIFERKVIRNIFGLIYNIELLTFKRRKKVDLYRLYRKPNILSYKIIKRMEWFGHVWRADNDIIIRKVLADTIHKKIPIGRPNEMERYCRERNQKIWKKCVS